MPASRERDPIDLAISEGNCYELFCLLNLPHPILTPEKERELGFQIVDGRLAEERLESGADLPEDERLTLEKMVTVGKQCQEELFGHNLMRLVRATRKAGGGNGRRELFPDLLQDAAEWVVKSIEERFDPEKGGSLAAFLYPQARRGVQKGIARIAFHTKVPVSVVDSKSREIFGSMEEFFAKNRREPTDEEISEATGLSLEDVKLVRMAYASVNNSLNSARYSDDDRGEEWIETIPDLANVELAIEEREMQEIIDEVLETLSPRQEKVLKKCFWLDATLDEIGEELGVTGERVRQIRDKALKRLRHPSRSRRLKDLL